jgi:energy-coupling factor transport system permease protein
MAMGTAVRIMGDESFVHKLSPITKMILVTLFIITALATFEIIPLLGMIGISLALWVLAKFDARNLKPVLAVTSSVAVLMILFNGFFFYNGKTALFYVFGHPFWAEGVFFGAIIMLKVFTVVTIVPILISTTAMPHFMAGLAALKMPYKLVFTFGMAFRLVPLIGLTFKDITESQKLRGHDIEEMKTKDKLIKGYIPLFVPLILTLMRRSADLDIAVESRGFGAPVKRTSLIDIALKTKDIIFLIVTGAIFFGILYYTFFGGGKYIYDVISAH